jgi:CRP/FNR family transcriptional regulator
MPNSDAADYAVLSALKACHLFRRLPSAHISGLALIASRVNAGKGRVLFHQGDPASEMFVLSSGQVRLYKLSEDGKQQTIRIVEAGEAFAEAAMFSGASYPVYAETISDSKLVSIPKDGIIELLSRDPTFATNLIGSLAELLREVTDLVEELSLREVASRLAGYLIETIQGAAEPAPGTSRDDRIKIELTISKSELSKKLGTSPETLSRTLRKLSNMKILDVEGKIIIVHRRDLLESLAEGAKISEL